MVRKTPVRLQVKDMILIHVNDSVNKIIEDLEKIIF